MKTTFTTTTAHKFTIEVNAHVPASYADIISAIENGINQEVPEKRDELRTFAISAVNKMFKDVATNYVMLSDDVLKTLCNGVSYGKLTATKDGDTVTINGDLSMRRVSVGKVDKSPVYENRLDYIQYTDVVRALNAYNKQLKKEGFKDGYTLKRGINASQFNLLTVFSHNLAGKISDKDMRIIEKSGEAFAPFASDSNTKRLEAVQFFYDIFNAHTGNNYKAIGFVVKELRNDKRLATFDSQHYISTIPGEYTLLSVLISHYLNTGKKALEKSKAKDIATIQPIVKNDEPAPVEKQEERTDTAPETIYLIDPPCVSDNRELQYLEEAEKLYKAGKLDKLTIQKVDGKTIVTYRR